MTNNPVPSKVSTAISTLEELGLAKNEAILYDALLKTTDATIPYLLKNTPFSRTLLYYLLGNLEGYGLITSGNKAKGDGKKTVYNAEPPDKLADMLKDREAEFKKQKDLLGGIMGDLYSTYRLAHYKPGVAFYEGSKGIAEMYNYVAGQFKEGVEVLSFVKVGDAAVALDVKSVVDGFIKKRIAAKIQTRVLAIDTPEARELQKNDAKSFRKTKFITKHNLPFDFPGSEIFLYNNEVCVVTVEKQNYFAYRVSSAALSQMLGALFYAEWELLP